MPLGGTGGCSILPPPRGLRPFPGAWFLVGAGGGSRSNPPPPPAAPWVPGIGPTPGLAAASALQPAWPSLPRHRALHTSPRRFTRAEATGCHQRRPRTGVTGPLPRSRMVAGDEKQHLLSEGTGG